MFGLAAAGTLATGACGSGTNDNQAAVTATAVATVGSGGMSGSTSMSSTGGMAASSTVGAGGQGGMMVPSCKTTAKGQLRGSAIALNSDDTRLVSVNRDVGTVTVMSVDYGDGLPKMTSVGELAVGGEPWQAVINGCDDTAYVISRKDQQLIEIKNLKTTPTVGAKLHVGSEPTGLAITPNNTAIYVANWVDGTLTVVDPAKMTVTSTVNLNAALAQTNLLGMNVAARAGLAHPRAIAITNNGDANDADETVFVTEWFAQRTAPEADDGKSSDTNKQGLVYKVSAMNGSVTTIALPPIQDTGFNNSLNAATGCFPNQVAAITIDNGFAYVSSTCASPVGPIGAFTKNGCTKANDTCAAVVGVGSICNSLAPDMNINKTGQTVQSCTLTCQVDADCGFGATNGSCVGGGAAKTGQCLPIPTDFKTTSHPAVSIINIGAGTATTTNLDKLFEDTTQNAKAEVSARIPLLQQDIGFRPGFAYVAAEGTDALFRLVITNGQITKVASPVNSFIDMHKDATDKALRLPIGVATGTTKGVAFVNNYGTRDVTAVDLNSQAIAVTSGMMDFRITSATMPPAANSPEESVLKGRRFFVTGLGRWSFKGGFAGGQGWGSCEVCHVDGLTDNVTFYFARGPRQSISLDGDYNKKDLTDRRVLNWTAIFDEVADFEGNVRGVSGGVGAIVSVNGAAIANTDRIDTAGQTPPQQGLQGSSLDAADPAGPSGAAHPHSIIGDWLDITNYIKTIRSPRRPTNLPDDNNDAGGFKKGDVSAGKTLFTDPLSANCIGCHSGRKWTVSNVFYAPNDLHNDPDNKFTPPNSLSAVSYEGMLNGFPASLIPGPATNRFDRICNGGAQMNGTCNVAALEQLQCALRPVGTMAPGANPVMAGVSPAGVHVVELRADMATLGQGNNVNGNGFNVPSLLGIQVGAPYFHAGNARTLEEVLSPTFATHYQAFAAAFNPSADQIRQLTAFLLSIDDTMIDADVPPVPTKGAKGGDLCVKPAM